MTERADVLVIGAGIVGAGIARLLARAGVSVTLLDRGDLAGGTSSRSSHMIHGGLRYLEHGELALVREALRERAALLAMAPHLVRPVRFLVPFYRHDRRPPWLVRVGLRLYDALAGAANLESHRCVRAAEALQLMPGLERRDLSGGALYSDAVMDDARLGLAAARDAAERGAQVRSYTEALAARPLSGEGLEVRTRDLLQDEERAVHARIVVNAAGPWADQVRSRLLGDPEPDPGRSRALLRPSRGSHVVFPGTAADVGLLFFARSDGRVMFVVPTGEHRLAGTTEVEPAGDPGDDLPGEAEVRYLLRETRRVLPDGDYDGRRALGLTSGVRPLARSPRRSLGAVSREHRVTVEGSLVNVVGGKYTTFRPMCAEVAGLVLRRLGHAGRAGDQGAPLPGGDMGSFEGWGPREASRLQAAFPEAAAEIPRLLRAHGSRAAQLLERVPDRARPLLPGTPLLEAEVLYAVEVEWARRLDDVLRRRTSLWLSADFGRRAAPAVARCMAERLGWSDQRTREELARWWRFAATEETLLCSVAEAP